ncbi:hypothetical protein OZ712_003228 [Yersinia enterocolitica]|nr:hypothetical protein [Yersinia enterocolitica]EKN3484822.1 hypothetical protein [Yersinia enterocolitica]EKN3712393.1 hypothetical protein [Yersinia enterocolitica]EKN3836238.1 hypothetical protein [Yersinia enterocolitica]ELX2254642.1 hypothetical protein [Yersinia enterocolitica]
MRVVIYQGQYGIFKKNGLDLSMPAIQTCLGLYALSDQHDYLLCAHFDSAFGLQQNLQDIKRSIELNGIRMSSLRATVFGEDGKQSYLRCSAPSSHIGNEIVNFMKSHGALAQYSNQYYSGVFPETFNFHYQKGCGITKGQNPRDFLGGSPQAMNLAKQRIKLRPSEYSLTHAKMLDISRLY